MEPENVNPSSIQQETPPQQGPIGSTPPAAPNSPFGRLLKNNVFLAGVALVVAIFIIVVLWFISSQKQGGSHTPLGTSQEAQDAYLRGDLKTVQEKLLASYNSSPNDPKIQAALIKAIAVDGNLTGREQDAFVKAEPYVKKALATNKNSVDVLLAVGYVYEIAGKYTDALGFYENALQIDGNNAEGWFHKGHVMEFLGRNQEAYSSYKQAYTLNPKDPLIIIGAGRAAIADRKTDDAINLYISAGKLESAPLDLRSEAYTNASILKRNQFLYMDEAISLSALAVQYGPNFSPALAAHGYNLSINGSFDEGVGFMKKSLTANPRISQNYYFLGVIYRSVKDYTNALPYLEEAYQRIDNDNTILDTSLKAKIKGNMAYDLAKTYSLSKQNKNNAVLLQTALQLNPNLKNSLKSDYASGNLFGELSQDPAFQALIQ